MNSQKLYPLKTHQGFTIIEILVALIISSILVTAMYSSFINQQKSFTTQNQISVMQQNARAAMDFLCNEIRMAGYNPKQANGIGFVNADGLFRMPAKYQSLKTDREHIFFTIDLDGDGISGINDFDTNEPDGENAGYMLSDITLLRYSTGAVSWQAVAENIESINFDYLYSDGDDTASGAPLPDNTDTDDTNDLKNIVAVRVTLTARTEYPDQSYTDPLFMDHYRRITLSSLVKVRNSEQ